jgi:hypothetical protein
LGNWRPSQAASKASPISAVASGSKMQSFGELIGMVASLRKSLWDTSIQIQLTDTSAARDKLDMSRLAVKYKFVYFLMLLWTKERLPTNIFAASRL